jgi:hypothetical protein
MSAPSIHAVRRAILLLLATGLPICAGVWLEQPGGALIGCVCGLLFSFADDEGPLSKRFTILGMAAAAIALGGGAGVLMRGFPWPLWVLFAALTFAAGMANSIGKAPTLSARFCAMALIVASGLPVVSLAELVFPLGALAVVALTRAIDHHVAGPLVQQRPRPRTAPAGGWTRFAISYAATATASLWLGITIDPDRVAWVVVTTLVVMQSDARTSYVRIVQRIVGTVIGVVAAFAITRAVQSPWLIAACALAVAPFIPHHLHHRYWLHTALIALLVLLAYDLAAFDTRFLGGLFVERLQDVLIGGGLALIGTVLAFPRNPPDEA